MPRGPHVTDPYNVWWAPSDIKHVLWTGTFLRNFSGGEDVLASSKLGGGDKRSLWKVRNLCGIHNTHCSSASPNYSKIAQNSNCLLLHFCSKQIIWLPSAKDLASNSKLSRFEGFCFLETSWPQSDFWKTNSEWEKRRMVCVWIFWKNQDSSSTIWNLVLFFATFGHTIFCSGVEVWKTNKGLSITI